MENRNKSTFSVTFLWLAVLFCVCLVASNLFATKVISVFGINLPGAVVIFPISYILNDCIVEVWGYRKARLVIWMGFAMNFFVILAGQLVVWLPAASFWEGAPHFDFMSLAGEFTDSLIFMPIAFIGTPVRTLLYMMLAQVTFKVCYEIIILPVTTAVVRTLKKSEGIDVYDNGISYNPFRIGDV